MDKMKTPRTRAEFERKFNLLHRRIEEGRFHVVSGLCHTIEGIALVRYLPNGRIDFLSVNESARLTANSSAQFSDESFQDLLNEDQDSEGGAISSE